MADRSGIKVTASDALEFESVAPKARKGSGVLKTLIFVIVAVFAGAGGWAFYGERMMSMLNDSDGEVPIVRADLSPIKVRPDNPGGLQVPDRDKLVYDRIQNGGDNQGRATVERLLPPPENPLPIPKSEPARVVPQPTSNLLASKNPSIDTTPKLKDVEAAIKPAPAPAAPAIPKTLNELKTKGPTRLAKSTDVVTPTPEVPVVAPKSPTPTAAPKPVAAVAVQRPSSAQPPSNKVYRVQLAAARTSEAARKEWDRLRRSNLDVLGDLGLSVTKIDLGGTKGIFYRLRAGPLKDDKQARALCKALAKRKVGCLVVRPGK